MNIGNLLEINLIFGLKDSHSLVIQKLANQHHTDLLMQQM